MPSTPDRPAGTLASDDLRAGREWRVEHTGTTRRRALAAAAAAALLGVGGCSGSGDGDRGGPPPLTEAERARRAEEALRRRSAWVSRELLTRYDEAIGTHPSLASRLIPLRDATARHVAALAPEGEEEAGTATPTPPGSTAATPAAALSALSALSAGGARPAPFGPAPQPVARAHSTAAAAASGTPAGAAAWSRGPAGAAFEAAASGAPSMDPSEAAPSASPPSVPADPMAALKELAALASRTASAHTTALVTAPPELARLLASVAASAAGQAYLLSEGSRA